MEADDSAGDVPVSLQTQDVPVSVSAQFRAYVESRIERVTESGCWIWLGYVSPEGYGQVPIEVMHERTPSRVAHRVTYGIRHGFIPPVLDHLCRVKCCVNPDHLENVTVHENTMRCEYAPATINARKTHCNRGHEFTAENTYIGTRGSRICRVCHTAKTLESIARKAATRPRGPRGGRFRSDAKWCREMRAREDS